MNEQDFNRFSALMLGLAENYGQSLSPQGIALRFRALAEHGIDAVEQATLSLMLPRNLSHRQLFLCIIRLFRTAMPSAFWVPTNTTIFPRVTLEHPPLVHTDFSNLKTYFFTLAP